MEFHTTGEEVSTVIFGRTDAANPGDLLLPGTGTTRQYSYQKFIRLNMDSGNYATELRFSTAGIGAMGVTIWVGTTTSDAAHIVPSSADSPPLLDGVAMVDASTYTYGSPLDLDTGDGLYTSGDIGKFVVLVCECDESDTVGLKVGGNLIFRWREA
jgi:hypothetical protein